MLREEEPTRVVVTQKKTPPPPTTTMTETVGGPEDGRDPKVSRFRRPQLNFEMPAHMSSMNTAYVRSLSGVLKIVEILTSFIIYICALCSLRSGHADWTEFTAWTATIVPLIFFILYIVFPHWSLREEATRTGLILVEMIYNFFAALFYLVAFIAMAVLASWSWALRGGAVIACILSFIMIGIFVLDGCLKIREWRAISGASNTRTTNGDHRYGHTVPTVVA